MRLSVPNQGGDFVRLEEGIGEDLGWGETAGPRVRGVKVDDIQTYIRTGARR